MADPPFPPFPVQPKPSHQPPFLSSSAPPGPEPTTSARTDGRSETTKKKKQKENPSLLAAAEGSSSSPSNSSPASHEQPKGGTGADIESLLGILVGQVRDLKDSLKGVQKELKAVNKRQKMFEDHHRQLKERVELLIPLVAARASQSSSDGGGGTSPPSSSSVSSPEQASLPKLTAHPHIPAIPFPLPRSMPRTRAEILDYFPLLKSYEGLYSPDAPFVIDEFTKPIAIVLFVSPPEALAHKFLPPIYIYVNDAFCELLRYPLSEILACPVTKFSMPSEDNRANIMASLAEARPNGFSSITTFSPYAIKRDGTVIKLHGRHQMFFNETAHPKWGVMVVDSVSEENVFVEVRKVALQTLLNEFTASRHSAGLPTGFPACNFPGFPFPFPHGFGPDSASALMPASPLRQSLSMSAAFSAAAVAAAAAGKRKRAPDDDGTEPEGTASGENTAPHMPDGYGFVPSTPPALFQIQGLYSPSPSFLSGAEGAQHHHQGAHNAGGRRTEDNERAELRDLLAGLLSSPMPSPPPSSLSFPSGAGGDGDAPGISSLNFYNFGTSIITPVSPPPPSSPMYSAVQVLRDRRDFT